MRPRRSPRAPRRSAHVVVPRGRGDRDVLDVEQTARGGEHTVEHTVEPEIGAHELRVHVVLLALEGAQDVPEVGDRDGPASGSSRCRRARTRSYSATPPGPPPPRHLIEERGDRGTGADHARLGLVIGPVRRSRAAPPARHGRPGVRRGPPRSRARPGRLYAPTRALPHRAVARVLADRHEVGVLGGESDHALGVGGVRVEEVGRQTPERRRRDPDLARPSRMLREKVSDRVVSRSASSRTRSRSASERSTPPRAEVATHLSEEPLLVRVECRVVGVGEDGPERRVEQSARLHRVDELRLLLAASRTPSSGWDSLSRCDGAAASASAMSASFHRERRSRSVSSVSEMRRRSIAVTRSSRSRGRSSANARHPSRSRGRVRGPGENPASSDPRQGVRQRAMPPSPAHGCVAAGEDPSAQGADRGQGETDQGAAAALHLVGEGNRMPPPAATTRSPRGRPGAARTSP